MTHNIAFLFSGQGSQYNEMGKDLYYNYDIAKKTYDYAEDILNYKIKSISFENNNNLINETKYTQPAIFIYNYIAHKILGSSGIVPNAVAGHSLGEYNALVAASVINFETALQLVQQRADKMYEVGKSTPGKMAAILNYNLKSINDIIENYKSIVIANINSYKQIILSGSTCEMNDLLENFKKFNIRRITALNVSGAFHSPLMDEAQSYLKNILIKTDFNNAKIPIYQNTCPNKNTNSDNIKNNLIMQLNNKVDWLKTINQMNKDGIKDFIEVGPKQILKNLNKNIVPELGNYSYESIKENNYEFIK